MQMPTRLKVIANRETQLIGIMNVDLSTVILSLSEGDADALRVALSSAVSHLQGKPSVLETIVTIKS